MEQYIPSFIDELTKIAGVPGAVGNFLAEGGWKYPVAATGGIMAYLTAKQAKQDWETGRAYRKMMEQRQGG